MACWSETISTEAWLNSVRETLRENSCGVPISCPGNGTSCPSSCMGIPGSCPSTGRGCCPGGWLACLAQAWEVSGRSLEAVIQAHKDHLPNLLPTLFNFGPLVLMMLVDVRGFEPADIQVEALGVGVRLKITHHDTVRTAGGGLTAARYIDRIYEFPKPVAAQELVTTVRDGTLFLSVPWSIPQQTML